MSFHGCNECWSERHHLVFSFGAASKPMPPRTMFADQTDFWIHYCEPHWLELCVRDWVHYEQLRREQTL